MGNVGAVVEKRPEPVLSGEKEVQTLIKRLSISTDDDQRKGIISGVFDDKGKLKTDGLRQLASEFPDAFNKHALLPLTSALSSENLELRMAAVKAMIITPAGRDALKSEVKEYSNEPDTVKSILYPLTITPSTETIAFLRCMLTTTKRGKEIVDESQKPTTYYLSMLTLGTIGTSDAMKVLDDVHELLKAKVQKGDNTASAMSFMCEVCQFRGWNRIVSSALENTEALINKIGTAKSAEDESDNIERLRASSLRYLAALRSYPDVGQGLGPDTEAWKRFNMARNVVWNGELIPNPNFSSIIFDTKLETAVVRAELSFSQGKMTTQFTIQEPGKKPIKLNDLILTDTIPEKQIRDFIYFKPLEGEPKIVSLFGKLDEYLVASKGSVFKDEKRFELGRSIVEMVGAVSADAIAKLRQGRGRIQLEDSRFNVNAMVKHVVGSAEEILTQAVYGDDIESALSAVGFLADMGAVASLEKIMVDTNLDDKIVEKTLGVYTEALISKWKNNELKDKTPATYLLEVYARAVEARPTLRSKIIEELITAGMAGDTSAAQYMALIVQKGGVRVGPRGNETPVRESSREMRVEMIKALGKLGAAQDLVDVAVGHGLTIKGEEEREETMNAARSGLKGIIGKSLISALKTRLKEPKDEWENERTIELIKEFGNESIRTMLLENTGLKSKSDMVRKAAAEALGSIIQALNLSSLTDTVYSLLEVASADGQAKVRRAALDSIVKLMERGGDNILSYSSFTGMQADLKRRISSLLEHDSAAVRAGAINALIAMNMGSSIKDKLEESLQDEPEVKTAAAIAFLKMGMRSDEMADTLLKMVSEKEVSNALKVNALLAVSTFRKEDEKIAQRLAVFLDDESSDVRLEATKALKNVAGNTEKAVTDKLMVRLDDSDPRVASAAYSTLAAINPELSHMLFGRGKAIGKALRKHKEKGERR